MANIIHDTYYLHSPKQISTMYTLVSYYVTGIPLYQVFSQFSLGYLSTESTFEIETHSASILFWITKRQAISTDTSFETKMMVQSGAIEIIFNSHEPFQSFLLTGQA